MARLPLTLSTLPLFFLLGGCSPSSSEQYCPRCGISSKEHAYPISSRAVEKLRKVGAPLLRAAAEHTTSLHTDYGFSLQGSGSRGRIGAVFTTTDAKDQLQEGDKILAINGRNVERWKKEHQQEFLEQLGQLGTTSLSLALNRQGRIVTAHLKGVQQAHYTLHIASTHLVDAYFTNEELYLTAGLLSFVSHADHRAAFLSHLIAKRLLNEPEALLGNLASSPYSHSLEEVDHLALTLCAQAGYAIEGVPQVWRDLLTHAHHLRAEDFLEGNPVTEYRLERMEKAIQSIRSPAPPAG